MSWSISAIGKPARVAAKVEADLARITYLQGTEAELKDSAAALVKKAVEGNTRKDILVRVEANGSASKSEEGELQTIQIAVTQLYGFAE